VFKTRVTNKNIIVALDVDEFKDAVKIVNLLGNEVEIYKINSLFYDKNFDIVAYLKSIDKKIILDLKLSDSSTVLTAILKKRISDFVTVLLTNGVSELKTITSFSHITPIGITMFSSDDRQDHSNIRPILQNLKLVQKGYDCGIRHFLCPAMDAKTIRDKFPDVTLYCIKVASYGDVNYDPKFFVEPLDVVKSCDYLVMGRSVISKGSETRNYVKNLNRNIDQLRV
jgi:orotidine-5'-phosphate decarboxylase